LYDIDSSNLEDAFKEQHIDVVIHTACNYGRNNESLSDIAGTNIIFGLKVLEFAIKYNVSAFINTDTLLDKYINAYSLSKKQFVEWLKQQANKIKVINMKLEHMYGPNDDLNKFVPWLIQQLKNNVVQVPLTKGVQKRDFIYIDDVVSAYLKVLENIALLQQYSEFDVGTGTLISIYDFVSELANEFKKVCKNNVTELIFGALPYRQGEPMAVCVNVEPLRKIGWQPKYDYKNGIKQLLQEL
jgi:nucleoside-diphosphate-sugar epimerase